MVGDEDARVPVLWVYIADDLEARDLAGTPLPVLDMPPAPGLSSAEQLRAIAATYIARVEAAS